MRHIVIGLAGLFLGSFGVAGQVFRPYTEAGVMGGLCYYLGDINPRKQFYSPGMAIGGLIKHNITEHHSVRANVSVGHIKGNDLDFQNEYQQRRALDFETSLTDLFVGYEFNFMPYIINRKVKGRTPYIFAGVGYSFILSSSTGTAAAHATIPFGVGFKYRFSETVSIGCEWSMRKTFTDSLDGVLNPGADAGYSKTHNNDWYSFAGVYATFRIFEQKFECPGVLQEQKKYK